MYVFIEKRLKGGIPYMAKRYSEANNKYMTIVILQNHQDQYRTLT